MSERAFPADRELLALKNATKQLEEILCRPPAGLETEEIESIRMRRARELVRLARELEAEVNGKPRPVWRGYERPERTAYSSDDGVYHPAPSMPNYQRHIKVCDTCAGEWARANPREAIDAHPRTANHIVGCEFCKRETPREVLEDLGLIVDGVWRGGTPATDSDGGRG